MKTLEEIFHTLKLKGKIGHAYLLYNVTFDEIKDDINDILSKYFFCGKNINFNPDIHYIDSNTTISKEQIKELQHKISTKSQMNDNIVYIINNCDKMTPSASNSLLKMLEEPEENITAFLISDNITGVLPTIKSRCINLFMQNKKINSNLEEYSQLIIDIINDLNNNKVEIYNLLKNKSRDDIKIIFELICYVYRDFLNVKTNNKIEYINEKILIELKYLENTSINDIIDKILLLTKNSQKLNYNVNINMFIDNIVVDW